MSASHGSVRDTLDPAPSSTRRVGSGSAAARSFLGTQGCPRAHSRPDRLPTPTNPTVDRWATVIHLLRVHMINYTGVDKPLIH